MDTLYPCLLTAPEGAETHTQTPYIATRSFYFPKGEKFASHNEPALKYYFPSLN